MFKKSSSAESSAEAHDSYTPAIDEVMAQDSEAWVAKQLHDMNVYFDGDDWNDRSLKVLLTLLSEVI